MKYLTRICVARFIAQKMEAVKKVLAEANRGLAGKDVAQIEANWKAMVAGLEEAKSAHRNLFLASREELNAKYMLNMKEEYAYRLNVLSLNRFGLYSFSCLSKFFFFDMYINIGTLLTLKEERK